MRPVTGAVQRKTRPRRWLEVIKCSMPRVLDALNGAYMRSTTTVSVALRTLPPSSGRAFKLLRRPDLPDWKLYHRQRADGERPNDGAVYRSACCRYTDNYRGDLISRRQIVSGWTSGYLDSSAECCMYTKTNDVDTDTCVLIRIQRMRSSDRCDKITTRRGGRRCPFDLQLLITFHAENH